MKRLMCLFLVLVGVVFFDASAARADADLIYDVTGTNPGQTNGAPAYKGIVVMRRKGQVVTVIWKIGGQNVVGTGIIDGNTMAVGYPSANEPGVAFYARDPQTGVVNGQWVPGGGSSLGTERWIPRN
ncbi:Fibronectin-binding protein [Azospirillaceae bacterium]